MNQNHEPISDAQLDRYLDGLMDPVECQLLQQRLAGQPEIAQKIILQEKLDATLRRQFAPPTVRAEDMREFIFRHAMPHAPVSLMASFNAGRLAWPLIAVGAVAAAVWIAVVWRPDTVRHHEPFFEPQPVTKVYRDVLEQGFEPYYDCREEARFSATFSRRLGQPLRLASLPPGSRMLGLSYPGGLSRNTTAILCRVDGQPVMVLVDRLSEDQPLAARNTDRHLHVHRTVKAGLVFYEVTPFDTARVIDFLIPTP